MAARGLRKKFEESDESKGSDDASDGTIKPAVGGETLSFWDATIMHINTVKDIRLRDEVCVPSITGMCMLDNGDIILCDNANKKVKFLDDMSTRVKYDIQCENAPFDVANFDEKRVAVTMPEARKIQFVIVNPGAKLDKTIEVAGQCYGITVHENNFYVCMAEKGIHILSSTGMLKKGIPLASSGIPKYICLNSDATKICYSAGSDREAFVSYMTRDGHGLVKFTDDIQGPASLSVDQEENILLLDSAVNKIYVIRNKDSQTQCLLSKETKRYALTSMLYNNRNRKLVVAERWNSKEEIWVSKLKLYQFETETKSRFAMLGSLRRKWKK